MALPASRRGWGPGWPANRSKDMTTITVGDRAKVRLVVHKIVAPIFKAFCDEIDRRGYDLEGVADDWGYANRPIRNSKPPKPSNHSWGLAIDLNATKNPMGRRLVTDMPAWVIDLAERVYGLSWGGRYRSNPDAMHFEWLGTPAQAVQLIEDLAARGAPIEQGDDDLTPEQDRLLRDVHAAITNPNDPNNPAKLTLDGTDVQRDSLAALIRRLAAKLGVTGI